MEMFCNNPECECYIKYDGKNDVLVIPKLYREMQQQRLCYVHIGGYPKHPDIFNVRESRSRRKVQDMYFCDHCIEIHDEKIQQILDNNQNAGEQTRSV